MFKPYHQNNTDNQEADSHEAEGMFDILDAAGERKVEPASSDAPEQAAGAGDGQSAADQVDFDGALKHADIKPLDVSMSEPAGVESVDFSAVLKPVSVAQAVANTTMPVAGNSAAAAQPAVVAAAAAAAPEGVVASAAPAADAEHLADGVNAGIAAQPVQPAAVGGLDQPVVHTADFAFPSPDVAPAASELAVDVPAVDASASGSSIKFDQTEKPVAVASNAAAAPIEFDQTEKAAHEVVPEIVKSASDPAEASVLEKPAVETVSFEAAEKAEKVEKPVAPVVPDAPAVPVVPAASVASVAPAASTVSATPAMPHAAAPAAQPAAVHSAVAQPMTTTDSASAPAAPAPSAAVPAAEPVAPAAAPHHAPAAAAAVATAAPAVHGAPAPAAPVATAAVSPVASVADGHSTTSGKVADKNATKAKGGKKDKKNDDAEFGRSGMLSAVHHSAAWTVFFAILSLLWIYPIVLVFINSFKKKQFITGSATFELPNAESWTSFDNYTRGVQQTNLFASFGWTVFITVGAVALILVCTSMCAWWIVRVNNLFAKIIYMLFLFNMIVPFQMVMYPLSKLANMMGLDTPWGLWIIYLGFGAGLSVFMFTGVIKGLPSEIEESAMIDGASVPQTFFGIVWPMMKPSMVSVAILQTMWIWNDYLLPYLILDMKKYKTMSIAVQYLKGGFGSIDMGAMMGCLVLAMLPIIIFYLVCQKYIIAGVTAGAVKG